MNELEKIKENIRTINPNITDELLDLLYEYVMVRKLSNFQEHFDNTEEHNINYFSDVLNYLIKPLCK